MQMSSSNRTQGYTQATAVVMQEAGIHRPQTIGTCQVDGIHYDIMKWSRGYGGWGGVLWSECGMSPIGVCV